MVDRDSGRSPGVDSVPAQASSVPCTRARAVNKNAALAEAPDTARFREI